ncbi:hypothetical protein TNCV_734241 [Trichonephila clavipes]|nr:hypothetical protein TNCV_734241 [Trichonephila clavipes]
MPWALYSPRAPKGNHLLQGTVSSPAPLECGTRVEERTCVLHHVVEERSWTGDGNSFFPSGGLKKKVIPSLGTKVLSPECY